MKDKLYILYRYTCPRERVENYYVCHVAVNRAANLRQTCRRNKLPFTPTFNPRTQIAQSRFAVLSGNS